MQTVSADTHFSSPSGNITCLISSGFAACKARERDWQVPPQPASCPSQFDYGPTITLEASPEFYCGTDEVVYGSVPPEVLPYGHGIRFGAVECHSRPTGMTCANSESDHGFDVSREGYAFR